MELPIDLSVKRPAYKLGTILTSVSAHQLLSIDEQIKNIAAWDGSVARVFVHTQMPLPSYFGIRPVASDGEKTSFREVLANYVFQIPGADTVVICNPDVLVSKDSGVIIDYAINNRMEMVWGGYCLLGTETPRAFVVSAPVISHLLNDIPLDMKFASGEWRSWMHNWMTKFMMRHRYFDATKFNIISEGYAEPKAIEYKANILEAKAVNPEPFVPPAQPEKKKPGRKKKV